MDKNEEQIRYILWVGNKVISFFYDFQRKFMNTKNKH